MKKSPFFSVILNTYNSEKTVMRTLRSITNQTFRNFELIIIDDSSFDKTIEIIRNILINSDLEYYIYLSEKNRGISFSRNLGIKKARGKYIAFIDGDDMWEKDKLKKQYEFLISKNLLVDWVFSNYSVMNNDYKIIGKRRRKSGYYDYHAIIKNGNPVGMLTVVVKSNIIKKENFRNIKHEDYDLWIRLSKKGVMGFLLNDDLACYMKHGNSISSNKIKSALWTFKVFRRNGITSLKAFYLLIRYIFNSFTRKSLCE